MMEDEISELRQAAQLLRALAPQKKFSAALSWAMDHAADEIDHIVEHLETW